VQEKISPNMPIDVDKAYKTTINALHTYYKENFYDYFKQTHRKALKAYNNLNSNEMNSINSNFSYFIKKNSFGSSSNFGLSNEDAGCSGAIGYDFPISDIYLNIALNLNCS
jgi:hypothetical protein